MNSEPTSALRILRFPDVVMKTGLSKSAIYGRIRSQEFPAPVPLGARAVGFVSHEIDDWLANLIQCSRNAQDSKTRVPSIGDFNIDNARQAGVSPDGSSRVIDFGSLK